LCDCVGVRLKVNKGFGRGVGVFDNDMVGVGEEGKGMEVESFGFKSYGLVKGKGGEKRVGFESEGEFSFWGFFFLRIHF